MSDLNDRESDQPLSQNQVESLLKAMESFEPAASSQRTVAGSECRGTTIPKSSQPAIEPPLLSALEALHESAAVQVSQSLSELLRTNVDVKVAGVEPVGAIEFSQQSRQFGWVSVLSTDQGDWLLEIPPDLCCLMVDRMLGGDPTPGETFSRPMTDIERRLMARLVDHLLEHLQREWNHVADVHWNVRSGSTESFQDDRSLVQIRFAVAVANDQGVIRLAIPAAMISQHSSRLQDDEWRKRRGAAQKNQNAPINQNVAAAPIDVVVTLASSTISTSDLLDLNVGDVIATEQGVSESLDLAIQGIPKFKVRPGALRGKKAVQLESTVDHPPEK